MNNFEFLLNLDNTKRINNNENELCYNNSYISYFISHKIDPALFIIKDTLLKKIIKKQIIYINNSQLKEINNCINYITKNLENINQNKLYSVEEIQLINDIIKEINLKNNDANKLIKEKILNNSQNISIIISDSNDESNIDINDLIIENNHSNTHSNICIFQKIYYLSIKIKNAIKSGFKRTINYLRYLVNN